MPTGQTEQVSLANKLHAIENKYTEQTDGLRRIGILPLEGRSMPDISAYPLADIPYADDPSMERAVERLLTDYRQNHGHGRSYTQGLLNNIRNRNVRNTLDNLERELGINARISDSNDQIQNHGHGRSYTQRLFNNITNQDVRNTLDNLEHEPENNINARISDSNDQIQNHIGDLVGYAMNPNVNSVDQNHIYNFLRSVVH